ncbi:MAG: hypothetical protein NNA25_04015 [Nitrospira sp.]|nr:hypothetical protein [Nitrospira sp.]
MLRFVIPSARQAVLDMPTAHHAHQFALRSRTVRSWAATSGGAALVNHAAFSATPDIIAGDMSHRMQVIKPGCDPTEFIL